MTATNCRTSFTLKTVTSEECDTLEPSLDAVLHHSSGAGGQGSSVTEEQAPSGVGGLLKVVRQVKCWVRNRNTGALQPRAVRL